MRVWICILESLICLCAGLVWPIQAIALDYKPYNGFEGYQEIAITDDLYYVSFQGTSKSAPTEVEAGWKTRSAELCSNSGARYFIELRYSFEPILKCDPRFFAAHESPAIVKVFMIVFPVQTRRSYSTRDNTAYQAHMRCVYDRSQAIEKERLINAEEIITDSKARGWMTEPTR